MKSDELPISVIISALEECRELGMRSVKLTGGEPFVREDIFELLKYIKDKGINLNVETNAVLIREKEARALKDADAWQVAVSIDGADAGVHESLRGVSGSFDGAIQGIRALRAERLNVLIIASLWKGNREQLKEMILLAKSLGVSTVKINSLSVIARASVMKKNDETLTVKETLDCYHRLTDELRDEKSVRVVFDIPPVFLPLKAAAGESFGSCGIFNILGLLGDGRVSICGIGSVVDTLVLGRIGDDKIKDIWQNSQVLKDIRTGVPLQMEGICGRCIFKHYCLGKCRANAYYTGGSVKAPFGFCQTAYEEGLFPKSRMI